MTAEKVELAEPLANREGGLPSRGAASPERQQQGWLSGSGGSAAPQGIVGLAARRSRAWARRGTRSVGKKLSSEGPVRRCRHLPSCSCSLS